MGSIFSPSPSPLGDLIPAGIPIPATREARSPPSSWTPSTSTRPGAATSPVDLTTMVIDPPGEAAGGAPWPDPPPLEVLLGQIHHRAQGRGRIRCRWRCSLARSAAELEEEGGCTAGVRRRPHPREGGRAAPRDAATGGPPHRGSARARPGSALPRHRSTRPRHGSAPPSAVRAAPP